jgi:hypothetical protein
MTLPSRGIEKLCVHGSLEGVVPNISNTLVGVSCRKPTRYLSPLQPLNKYALPDIYFIKYHRYEKTYFIDANIP